MKSKIEFQNFDLHNRRLRKSLATISCLIEKGNEDLWPIFDKLENELIKHEQRRSRLSRYSQNQTGDKHTNTTS